MKLIKLLMFILLISFCSIIQYGCGGGNDEVSVSLAEEPVVPLVPDPPAIPDNGDWAIDLSVSPPDTGPALEVPYVALGKSIPSMANMEFTVEAWVLPQITNARGTIFSRGGDDEGMIFFFTNGRPYILLKYIDRSPGSAPAFQARDSVAYPADTWVHVAGVFTTAFHTGVHAPCFGYESQASHLDIYTNGLFRECGPTEGRSMAVMNYYETIGRSPTYGSYYACSFGSGWGCPTYVPNVQDKGNLVIDEVRFWGTARSAADIAACRNAELIPGTGQCGIENVGLLSYWKFDEGAGETIINDWALDQNNGSLEYCDANCDIGSATSIVYDCAAIAISNPGVLCTDPWIDNALGLIWQ